MISCPKQFFVWKEVNALVYSRKFFNQESSIQQKDRQTWPVWVTFLLHWTLHSLPSFVPLSPVEEFFLSKNIFRLFTVERERERGKRMFVKSRIFFYKAISVFICVGLSPILSSSHSLSLSLFLFSHLFLTSSTLFHSLPLKKYDRF